MAHFYSGEYRGLGFDVYPEGFRRFRIFSNYPYSIGDTTTIHIKIRRIDKARDTPIDPLDIKVRFPSGNTSPIVREQKYIPEKSEVIVQCYAIPTSGALEYWLGNPEEIDAKRLADISGNWKDQKWIVLLSAITGAIIGFVIGAAGNSILRAIRILLGE